MTSRHDMVLASEDQAEARVAKRLIAAAGGLEEAAAITGKSTSALSRYQTPNCPESMPSTVARALEAVTHGHAGHPLMTRFNADRAGFTLIKLPERLDCDRALKTVHGALAKLSKESGEAIGTIVADIADGRTTAAELERGIAELTDTIEAAVQLRAILEHRRKGAGGDE